MTQHAGKNSFFALYVFTVAVLVGAPLAGVLVTGLPVGPYLQFPPLTGYVQHAPFNPVIFAAGVLFSLFILLFLVYLCQGSLSQQRDGSSRVLLWWGWLGFVVVIVSWILAWNRFPWFSSLQPYTFTPLWLGYILSVNGVTVKRSGTCLLTADTRSFLLLFPVSAVFWWYFEWLNRFVQNWYYVGIENFSAHAYILHATLCFSTVLPAVISTCELVGTVLPGPVINGPTVKYGCGKAGGWILLSAMAGVLVGLAVIPDFLFPFVWIAPLLFITAIQCITGRQTCFSSLSVGNWRPVLLPALAALICGFFWEMWNWKSLTHWEYSIPWVDRYQLFAMPILGYLGYLPFGLECFLIATSVRSFFRPAEFGW